ncbi:hemerythrin domain-containing protein [Streptacidiphilus pinicola]|uniref:Hemerythrin domain-containing protein n=1 Tax=Streptacidiphilus pinicola TaxID=2219663 RepID=A0A2X0IMV1_9ACTN|nr:hemerythrin domain-containing protein [Streptacidiphilus pinicola]RAG86474.1 hemerythrin domain-containing protein [Streptacidiphilus pinicola]
MEHRGNVIAELTADHRDIERLFARIQALPPGDPMRKDAADRITIAWVRHEVAEEMFLYPVVRAAVRGGEDAAHGEVLQHTYIERALKRLERLDVPTMEFNRLVAQVIRDVRTHIATQERLLFPALADVCTPEELARLGEEIRDTRDHAPTRPHPAAPHHPPANRRIAPVIGLVDRARDAISGRGRGRAGVPPGVRG